MLCVCKNIRPELALVHDSQFDVCSHLAITWYQQLMIEEITPPSSITFPLPDYGSVARHRSVIVAERGLALTEAVPVAYAANRQAGPATQQRRKEREELPSE